MIEEAINRILELDKPNKVESARRPGVLRQAPYPTRTARIATVKVTTLAGLVDLVKEDIDE